MISILLRSLMMAALLAPACSSSPPAAERPPATASAPASNQPAITVSDTGDPASARMMGRRDAPVTIYEMSDFQCPYCRRHALETLPVLEREYIATGKVRYVFINFPITELHPNALPAAELGLCAARQDKFWPLHDLLFRSQESWAPLKDASAALLGLADSTIARSVEQEATASARAGANATPSFYIEGGLLIGAQPIEVFRPILDSIIAVRKR
jgi:protein-disulfide isomerase